jgi:sugar phosphate isomerase/epimerase
MPSIGFSTGALVQGALARGVDACRKMGLEAIELSALRHREVTGLVEYVRGHDLSGFSYVSVHAPTDYAADEEAAVATIFLELAREFHWPVVVHPDCIRSVDLWAPLGEWLCLENMDKRKSTGRTLEELEPWFETLPEAGFCFDIGHAHQVDPSMTEAYRMLREFGPRIRQLHVSEVGSSSRHDRMSEAAILAYREVAEQLPATVPVILETPLELYEARAEVAKVERIFVPIPFGAPS